MGSNEHFESAVNPLLEGLMRYCLYLSPSRWEAEDLFQDTLLKLLSYFRSHEPPALNKALLATTARHLWIDRHRKRERLGLMIPIEEAELVQRGADYTELRALVEWLAAHLSYKQMRMLLLAEIHRFTYQEIAEEMECTVPSVKMVLHRSKRLLRDARDEQACLKERLPEVELWTSELMSCGAAGR